jgi:hypothetical protein
LRNYSASLLFGETTKKIATLLLQVIAFRLEEVFQNRMASPNGVKLLFDHLLAFPFSELFYNFFA